MLSVEHLAKVGVGIVGFGKEGQSVARFLRAHNLSATIFDAKADQDFPSELIAEFRSAGFEFRLGEPLSGLSSCGILFRSPGVPRLSAAIVDAESHGVIITSQTKWFFDHCPAPIVGVTGTKGKGTTVSLIAAVLNAGVSQGSLQQLVGKGGSVYVTGNIGKDDPLDLLSRLTSNDVVVFELSSFQLQDLTVSPHVGVCLMVTQEHLDHHSDLTEYHAAKAAIASYQKPGDVIFYATDYPASKTIGLQGKGTKYEISRRHEVSCGVWAADETVRAVGVGENAAVSVRGRALRGEHNLENIAAAVGVGVYAGVPVHLMEQAITAFPGLEHRLEFVGTFAGVSFYNDSISTVPESTIAALEAFSEPIVLILGGSEKGSDFTFLGQKISSIQNIRGVIVVGDMTDRIGSALTAANFSGQIKIGARSMQEIFAQIKELAQTGDVVLLSPACASFGMFKNYVDRGNQFKALAARFGGELE